MNANCRTAHSTGGERHNINLKEKKKLVFVYVVRYTQQSQSQSVLNYKCNKLNPLAK